MTEEVNDHQQQNQNKQQHDDDINEEERRLRERLKAKSMMHRRTSNERSESTNPEHRRSRSRERSRRSRSNDRDRYGRNERYNGYNRGGGGGGGGGYPARYDPYYPPPPPPARGGPPPRGGGGGYYGGPPGAPAYWRGGPPPPGAGRRYNPYERDAVDDFGRRYPPRGASRSNSRSRSRSRSNSRGASYYSSDSSRSPKGRSRRRSRSRSRSRSRDRRSPSVSSHSSYSDSSISSRSSEETNLSAEDNDKMPPVQDEFSKDQRTVFVTQLVMRTTEHDIKKYFTKQGCKVNEVILLRDKRTGQHKGCAYVELRRMEDVSKAVNLSGQAPDFQRFPMLIKASEAEKNYVASSSQATVTASQMGAKIDLQPVLGPNGKLVEAQKVYVGSLDPSVSQEHLYALYSPFGQLEKVALQIDSTTGLSKGFAFLSFRDPKEANLAIQTMSNQTLAGRPMKTGWANQVAPSTNIEIVTSSEFPPDAGIRAQKAFQVLAQLTLGVPVASISSTATTATTAATAGPSASAGTATTSVPSTASGSRIPTVAEARASLAATAVGASVVPAPAVPPPAVELAPTVATAAAAVIDPLKIGNSEHPTRHVLVHNMFDKDQETEPGWENEIRVEFIEECMKFGTILNVTVMSKEPGGKIYASFSTVEQAQTCASTLAGRWFDQRQLRVEFVTDEAVPH